MTFVEMQLSVLIPAGKYDCYHHVTNESFHFDYSVEGGGNLGNGDQEWGDKKVYGVRLGKRWERELNIDTSSPPQCMKHHI